MKRVLIKYFFLLLFLYLATVSCFAQDFRDSAGKTFTKIETAFSENKIEIISEFIDNTTFISLSNGVVGYFSTDQTLNILKKFLDENKPVQFNLSNKKTETRKPFATGNFNYISDGIRKQSRVFVSMYLSNDKWIISQITIN